MTLQLDLEGTGRSPQTLIGSLAGNGVVSLSQGQLAALNPKVFEQATRAVDEGAPIDPKKIADVAERALESGPLPVPAAEGVLTVSHGQLRLANLATRADGADLTVAGSLDLLDQTLSARLTLSGGKNWPQVSAEPVVSVFLNGPLSNPKRTIDASLLTTWLTLRAVEQQSRQLEAMEARRSQPTAIRPVEVPATTSSAPAAKMQAPPLPPAIEVPSLPKIIEERPARAPARAQSGTAAQPRPVPQRPLQILPGAN
jgi:large subunit ribosomal protein L24